MPPDNQENPVLGIDLGTTFSAIARWTGRGPEVYLMLTGDSELQSAVYSAHSDDPTKSEILVGKLAYKKGLINPENLCLGVKRKMDDNSQRITIGGKEFSPVELSSEILSYLYHNVEAKFPKGRFESRGSVVTVPYYFKAHQCANTRKAAEEADIQCLDILQEPIAASLTYAWDLVTNHPDEEREELMLVFDLGGGTFDLTLFNLKLTSDLLAFEVLATGGNDRLGGMDFDNCLSKRLLEMAGLSLDGLEPLDKKKANQKLLDQTIVTKEALSFMTETYVAIPNLLGDKHLELNISRAEFESCIEEYMVKIREELRQIWVAAKKKPADVDRVILVGGSSKIPCVRALLCQEIGEDKIYANINVSHAVAEGAALYAAYKDDDKVFGRKIEITTRTCHALGVEVRGPDGDGGRFSVIIPANRKAPCENTQMFATDQDDATSLDIKVYQGSSRKVKDNSLIGIVKIRDLPKRPARELDIRVTFKVSEDQKLTVKTRYEGKDGEKKDVQNVFAMQ